MLSIVAFRHDDASTLALLVYLELIVSVLIGYLAFHEIPDLATILGAAFIIVAGLLLVPRERAA